MANKRNDDISFKFFNISLRWNEILKNQKTYEYLFMKKRKKWYGRLKFSLKGNHIIFVNYGNKNLEQNDNLIESKK
ncbi:hypothetical protein BpHYR1_009875 [Brachionus plicatilis]|uniref:Uncharacterized protein n=1 Tax=Brachionus plicatilis TaxID=10195 RepID=A0A3M7RJM5_BRAPC|nr:hypothetical protein BpHYR1_009875 [Brachionus plicatilis]